MDKKPLNILIVDDSLDEHELYREYLNGDPSGGYRFLDAYTGAEGEKLFHENPVDCVILDYRLPDIDGLEVLRRITRNHEAVPVVMLTGEGNETIAVIAMKIGSQDYLTKRAVTSQGLRRAVEHSIEHARLTQRIEDYRRDMERSNQDLERFADVVAHDLKSPLRAITQHLQLIRDHTHDTLDEKSLKSIGFAIVGAERMRRLIEAVFEFSKAGFEKPAFVRVDCNLALDSVKFNLSATIEESGADITSDPLPTVMADSVQVMQLLQNLIANALKFCKDQPKIHVAARRDGAMWALSVRDNGIGIAKSAQDRIFTIFQRLHSEEEYPGSGVGLAICDRVVKNHGGSIGVESEAGRGATFTFTLPAHDESPREKAT